MYTKSNSSLSTDDYVAIAALVNCLLGLCMEYMGHKANEVAGRWPVSCK
jgi:hypothetical protein